MLEILKPVLENSSILKIGQNMKFDYKILKKYSISLNSYEDTMLMSYCLNSGLHRHNLDTLSEIFLNHNSIKIDSLLGSGKNKKNFSQTPIDLATNYAAEDADITLRLWKIFRPKLSEKKVSMIYHYIELKLIAVLAQMEMTGILVDSKSYQVSSQFLKN